MTDDDFNTVEVNIATEKLQSKHDFYALYHVTVAVCSDSFARTIEILMSSSSWPEGFLVRRFYIFEIRDFEELRTVNEY